MKNKTKNKIKKIFWITWAIIGILLLVFDISLYIKMQPATPPLELNQALGMVAWFIIGIITLMAYSAITLLILLIWLIIKIFK
jgi:hypothetical protein